MKKLIKWGLNKIPRRYIQLGVHILMPVAALFYEGKKVECPVCGKGFRKFLPYGYVSVRENALCPGCLALERHRMMWMYLREQTRFFDGPGRILHVAPERCFIKRFRKLLGKNYVTTDIESPLADVKADIQALPFGDGEFDVVFCNHILEHVDDDRRAMREILRVLRPGGWGILLSPVTASLETTYEDPSITTPEGRQAAFGQYDHRRVYGRDYGQRLRGEGFIVREIDYASAVGPQTVSKYALGEDKIYLVEKPA